MKAIFLDIDGVLLPGRAHRLPPGAFPDPRIHRFDAVTVDMLRELVTDTGAKLVWSTSWKSHGRQVLDHIALANGIELPWFHEHSVTPSLRHDRPAEIAAWIAEHGPAEWFALDDDADLQGEEAGILLNDPHGVRRPRFSRYDGITASIYTQASCVLGSDRFAAKYRIGRAKDGSYRLFIGYPKTRLRHILPERIIGPFVFASGVWMKLTMVLDDQEALTETALAEGVDLSDAKLDLPLLVDKP